METSQIFMYAFAGVLAAVVVGLVLYRFITDEKAKKNGGDDSDGGSGGSQDASQDARLAELERRQRENEKDQKLTPTVYHHFAGPQWWGYAPRWAVWPRRRFWSGRMHRVRGRVGRRR